MYEQQKKNRSLSAKTFGRWLLIAILTGAVGPSGAVSAKNDVSADITAAVQPLLKARLEAIRSGPAAVVGGRNLYGPAMVRVFYSQRNYRPAWISAGGSGRRVDGLLAALEDLRLEALFPEAYHLEALKRLVNDTQSIGLLREKIRLELLVDMELLATDAFFTGAVHLLGGRVAPETLGPEQQAVEKDADLIGALDAAVESGRVQPVLYSFIPDHEGYRRLRLALQRYRRIVQDGGWMEVADGAVMRSARQDPRVPVLRSRLVAEGYLDQRYRVGGYRFDPALKQAIEAFQRQQGLAVDGAVGPLTRETLNVPAHLRVRQIELNMERWRWMPRYLGNRYLLVNIADFTLSVVEGNRPAMVMRVAVGRDYRRTPVFSAELNQIVLNPHWYVPPTIFAEDLLPAIRSNPDYLRQYGYKIFSSLGPDGQEVDPENIDWLAFDPEHFPYILRKDPGPFNPMGRAKFLFPNRYDVYLHDSPDRSIFARSKRTFSSGCIRIEKPIELAEYLLKDSTRWSRQRILEEIESGRSIVIEQFDPLPITIQYWTVWVDENGAVQFRDDIYGRDAVLDEALFKMHDF